MFAHRHGLNGGREVGVVRRHDTDRVDVIAHLIKHHPEVIVGLGIGEPFQIFYDVSRRDKIHIRKRHRSRRPIAAKIRDHGRGPSPHANAAQIEPLTRW